MGSSEPPRISELVALSQYVYVQCNGSNITELRKLRFIDRNRSYCNDILDTFSLFGIEATRRLIIMEIISSMKSNAVTINSRHVTLLADFMVNLGRPYGTTRTGLSKQAVGFLSQATYEKAMTVLAKCAAVGGSEALTSSSAAIAVGSSISIGTGSIETISMSREQINKMMGRQIAAFDANDITALEELEKPAREETPIIKVPQIPNKGLTSILSKLAKTSVVQLGPVVIDYNTTLLLDEDDLTSLLNSTSLYKGVIPAFINDLYADLRYGAPVNYGSSDILFQYVMTV
jgi:hypothetical protein